MNYWFEIKKTLLEMIRDRGYDISQENDILYMDDDGFIKYYNSLLDKYNYESPDKQKISNLESFLLFSSNTYYSVNKTDLKILKIGFLELKVNKAKISTEQISDLISKLTIEPKNNKKEYCDELILIINDEIVPAAKKQLDDLTSVNTSIFFDKELFYNPTNHIDCPQFFLLTDTEKADLIRNLKCKLSDFLIIKHSDPVIKYYGWKRGQIVKIIRDDEFYNVISPISINYRVII
jgi:DNA-directed RNA polymerase I, II, and III subunit RPABC1